jgi:hypothetical protein
MMMRRRWRARRPIKVQKNDPDEGGAEAEVLTRVEIRRAKGVRSINIIIVEVDLVHAAAVLVVKVIAVVVAVEALAGGRVRSTTTSIIIRRIARSITRSIIRRIARSITRSITREVAAEAAAAAAQVKALQHQQQQRAPAWLVDSECMAS